MPRPIVSLMPTWVALVLSISMIAAWPVSLIAQVPLTILGLTIPEKVAGLPHGQPRDHEKKYPGLGYSVQFTRADWGITVYIYTLNMKSIPDDPMSAPIKNELVEAKRDVVEMEKRGNYSNVVVKHDYTVTDAIGRIRFLCSDFTYFAGRNIDSYVCLTSWKNKFIKIRMTASQNAASRADALRFVQSWIPVLWP